MTAPGVIDTKRLGPAIPAHSEVSCLSRGRAPYVLRDSTEQKVGICVIVLGLILLIIGFIAKVAILWTIGIVLVLVGLVLMVLESMGRAVGGRRHYY